MQSQLFFPLVIKDVTLKNRIGISPMCQYSSEDGFANNWHLVHLGSRAVGNAALIILEATAVSPEGRITPSDLGIWKDEHVIKLKEINEFIAENGAVPGIQLAHAGRKASITEPWNDNFKLGDAQGGWQTVGPSNIGYQDEFPPKALDRSGIDKVIADFTAATERAVKANFKVLEIHGAHGYLLHQFLSPISNKRTDKYGGSFENRVRLTLEIVDAVKTKWPNNLPLFVRVSATDWADGGWNIDDTVKLCKLLADKGVDLIDVSSGGLTSEQQIPIRPNYQVAFAERIRIEAEIKTAAVGLITDASQAEDILENKQADLVFFGREALRNPYIALSFADDLHADVKWPKQYERAKPEDDN